MQTPSDQGTNERRSVREHSAVAISSTKTDTAALAARIAALETRVRSLSWETNHVWSFTNSTRTDLNRELGARRIRHENVCRDIRSWAYSQEGLEDDYYRLRQDFNDLLSAIAPVLAGGDDVTRARSRNTVSNLMRRRRDHERWGYFDAGDVPSPRPESPFAVIDAEYNDVITNANANAN